MISPSPGSSTVPYCTRPPGHGAAGPRVCRAVTARPPRLGRGPGPRCRPWVPQGPALRQAGAEPPAEPGSADDRVGDSESVTPGHRGARRRAAPGAEPRRRHWACHDSDDPH
eukprot:765353-Hanusia_phi.AAC.6